jgi:hypothetical protein
MIFHVKKVTLSVIATTLFVVTAQAETTLIRNNTVSTFGPITTGTYVGYVGVDNGNGPDGKPAAHVVIDVCSYIPDEQHRYCIYAEGYAPLSTMTWKDAELVSIDLPNISTLQNGGVVDCTSGACVGGPVPPLAFRGTWTRYRGPSSSESEMFGTSKFVIRFDASIITERRTGLNRSYSAAFLGNLGNVQLTIPGTQQARIISAQSVSVEMQRTTP